MTRHQRRGSVYVIVLFTTMGVVAFALAGLTVRRTQSETADLTTDLVQARGLAASASNLARYRITNQIVTLDVGRILSLGEGSDRVITASIESITYADTCGYRRSPKAFTLRSQGDAGLARARLATDFLAEQPSHPLTDLIASMSADHHWPLDEPEDSVSFCNTLDSVTASSLLIAPPGHLERENGGPAPIIQDTYRALRIPVDKSFDYNEFTITIWVRFASAYDGTRGVLYSQSATQGASPNLDFTINPATGRVNVTVGDEDDNVTFQPVVSVSENTWHMLTVVGKENKELDFYFDGAHVATGPTLTTKWTAKDAANITVGAQLNWASYPMNALDGAVRDLAIFPKELDAADIAALYQAGNEGPDLTAYARTSRWATD